MFTNVTSNNVFEKKTSNKFLVIFHYIVIYIETMVRLCRIKIRKKMCAIVLNI